MQFRIGQGVDLHPFESGRKLILGGVEIDSPFGLKGHSDADALTHAICDALLGALSLGDLGQHFPDTDPANKGKESIFFLKEILKKISSKGWKISNLDSTLVTEEPILRPYIDSMKMKLSAVLGVELDQVSIKATRPEKMGALGRKEGLLALATVLLVRS